MVCVFWVLLSISISFASVKLKCWIVGNDRRETSFSPEAVTNLIDGVNQIYQQVVMDFEIDSISYTNNTYLSDLVYTNSAQRRAICDISRNTNMLELYFIRSITGTVRAFTTSKGIVIGPDADVRTVAHEIGHACGLRDIYNSYTNVSLRVDGYPSRERMPNDWGWYPPNVTQADVIRRMLMYGYESPVKIDITYGDVHGLWYYQLKDPQTRRWTKIWNVSLAPVGFGIHGNRHPVSE